jgi:hypothetical protein
MRSITALVGAALLMAAPWMPAQALEIRTGSADLDATLASLNVEAHADLSAFRAEVSASFGVPRSRIDAMIVVDRMEPAEVYLALELASLSGRPIDVVMETYRAEREQGWGRIASELGIEPGSREFQALKSHSRGRLEETKARGKGKA